MTGALSVVAGIVLGRTPDAGQVIDRGAHRHAALGSVVDTSRASDQPTPNRSPTEISRSGNACGLSVSPTRTGVMRP